MLHRHSNIHKLTEEKLSNEHHVSEILSKEEEIKKTQLLISQLQLQLQNLRSDLEVKTAEHLKEIQELQHTLDETKAQLKNVVKMYKKQQKQSETNKKLLDSLQSTIQQITNNSVI